MVISLLLCLFSLFFAVKFYGTNLLIIYWFFNSHINYFLSSFVVLGCQNSVPVNVKMCLTSLCVTALDKLNGFYIPEVRLICAVTSSWVLSGKRKQFTSTLQPLKYVLGQLIVIVTSWRNVSLCLHALQSVRYSPELPTRYHWLSECIYNIRLWNVVEKAFQIQFPFFMM